MVFTERERERERNAFARREAHESKRDARVLGIIMHAYVAKEFTSLPPSSIPSSSATRTFSSFFLASCAVFRAMSSMVIIPFYQAESEERMKVFEEICRNHVGADILTRYVHGMVKVRSGLTH